VTDKSVVTFHLWRVRRAALPRALWHVAADRWSLRRQPGLRFARLLGTASGFRPRDADPTRWAVVATWADDAAARAFESGPLVRRWDTLAAERWRARLAPVSTRGRWSGRDPFGILSEPTAGPIAALTRARLNPLRTRRFRRSVPAVAADLRGRDGLRFAIGVGEWPIGLQGTFSVWNSTEALRAFAHDGAHREVVRRTPGEGWYAEELFTRFSVLRASGTVDGRVVFP
jgi:hypothetical protein